MKEIGESLIKPFIIIVVFFLSLFALIKFSGPIPLYIQNTNTMKDSLFTVSGSGEVNAIPDTALISVGVSKTATTVSDAKSQIDAVINNITSEVRKIGVEDKYIKTTNYSITPKYDDRPWMSGGGGSSTTAIGAMESMSAEEGSLMTDSSPDGSVSNMMIDEDLTNNGTALASPPYDDPVAIPIDPSEGDPRIIGYTAYAEIQIEVKPIDKANKVYDAATKLGANRVGSPQFTIDDDKRKELQKKARKLAIDEAKEKAQDIAKTSGLNLGKIVDVSEGYDYYPVAYSAKYMAEDSYSGMGADINPGENTVRVNVTITYETN